MNFSVEEIGHLNFGLELCKAIHKFYDAITYIPPYGNQLLRKTNLEECISMAQSLVDILIKMQHSLEERYKWVQMVCHFPELYSV